MLKYVRERGEAIEGIRAMKEGRRKNSSTVSIPCYVGSSCCGRKLSIVPNIDII